MTKEEWEIEQVTASENARNLRDLVASAGWATYTQIIESQAKAREQNYLFTPLKSADAIYEQEFAKGEIHALRLAAALPLTMLESLEQDLAALGEEYNGNE